MNTQDERQYTQATITTAGNLRTIAQTLMAQDLSRLSLPEIEEAVDIVSNMIPAGNVPGVILNGLARLKGRRPPPQTITRDINLLFKGVEQVLDQAVYAAFFAGPAAVIWGYQNLLKLAGKSPEDAFPQGTWQFYVNYALREDTARHTTETHGFDTILNVHGITLDNIDRITAWVMTAIHTLHEYNELLALEWRERVHIRLLNEQSGGNPLTMYAQWVKQKPYSRHADVGNMSYANYRRALFDQFIQKHQATFAQDQLDQWQRQVAMLEQESLPAYQRQMSISSYLQPDTYNETAVAIPITETFIGLVYQGGYYLIPVCQSDTESAPRVDHIREQVAAIIRGDVVAEKASLRHLATIKRSAITKTLRQLNVQAQESLEALRHAPILINADSRPRHLALSEVRLGERGIGDHALTIFDTSVTYVFDQSHIYFDGAWGAALAEIMTNEALSWARYLSDLPPAKTSHTNSIYPLAFHWKQNDHDTIRNSPMAVVESSAESDQTNIKAILSLRKIFKQRNDLLLLTVNDLLVLYRAIHAFTYQPSPQINHQLEQLMSDSQTETAANAAFEAIHTHENPAILIPIDASQASPLERLYPMSFDVPIHELNIIEIHAQTVGALEFYNAGDGNRQELYEHFNELQREYLATLAGFGAVLSRAKEIAVSGDSASSGSIRLLAHMPRALQQLLDGVPSKIDLLNDIIKGREVFSNVGAVSSTSTLTRFITAKDDNEKKTLAWGIITDAQGVMRISLRDFRPHVRALNAVQQNQMAQRITQDYLDAYVIGLNNYVRDLRHIALASRETRMTTE